MNFKNIFKREEKEERKSVNFSKTFYQNLGEPIWTNRNYVKMAEESYLKNVIANRCISIIANSASSVLLKVKNLDTGEILKTHPLLDLLYKPNIVMNTMDFFKTIYSHKILAGNVYLQALFNKNEKFINPLELYLLRPDRVNILAGKNGLPVGYKYKVNSLEKIFYIDQIDGKCEILHIKNFHPTNDYYGLSEVEPAAYSIDQHNEASKWNQAMLQNGARPSGALIVKTDGNHEGYLTDEQFDRLKNQLNEEYSGSQNAGRPLLLEGGLDWKEMSLSPKDMDFLNVKYSTARDIALSFGVPSQLIGIPGDNSYNNFAEARLFLWEQTIIPLIESVLDNLNSWLCPMYKDKIEIFYDKNSITALSIRRESLWNNINNATFLTDNEKRELLNIDVLTKKK